jgi:hypothetical protein
LKEKRHTPHVEFLITQKLVKATRLVFAEKRSKKHCTVTARALTPTLGALARDSDLSTLEERKCKEDDDDDDDDGDDDDEFSLCR